MHVRSRLGPTRLEGLEAYVCPDLDDCPCTGLTFIKWYARFHTQMYSYHHTPVTASTLADTSGATS
jgi:hypothetical protein